MPAGRVLDGARLYVDVVEINPPLIIALNVAVVWIARALGLSEILVYRVGFTAVLLGSLWLTAALLRGLLRHDMRLRRVLVLTIAFVLFPLAGVDFGEREHLVLALLVPYLLLTTGRLARRAIANAPAAALGLLAGLAIALKPHFILVWFAIEVLLRGSRRVPRRALLPESLAVAGFLVTYVLLILLLTPAYLDLLRLLAIPYAHFLHEPFLPAARDGSGCRSGCVRAAGVRRPQAPGPPPGAVGRVRAGDGRLPGRWSRAAEGSPVPLLSGVRPGHRGAGAGRGRRGHRGAQTRPSDLSLAGGRRACCDRHGGVRPSGAQGGWGGPTIPARAQFERLVDVVRSRAAGRRRLRHVLSPAVGLPADQLRPRPVSLAIPSSLAPGRRVPGRAEE